MAETGQVMRQKGGDSFEVFAVSPYMLMPSTVGKFSVFLRQNDELVLYTSRGEGFTAKHRRRLAEMGVKKVYISAGERNSYQNYVQDNLGPILTDKDIPVAERGTTWHEVSLNMARDVFDQKVPAPLNKARFAKLQQLVQHSVTLLKDAEALKRLAPIIVKGFKIYHHSVGTMVFTVCVLQMVPETSDSLIVNAGTGALLHDIGKTRLPKALLNKSEEDLSFAELKKYQSHPALGVVACSGLPLPQEVMNCILFHHEQEDGRGYPTGTPGPDIPRYVKALSVCNAYDALTRPTAARPAMTPYNALNIIKSRKSAFDLNMIKRLIGVLANAEIT